MKGVGRVNFTSPNCSVFFLVGFPPNGKDLDCHCMLCLTCHHASRHMWEGMTAQKCQLARTQKSDLLSPYPFTRAVSKSLPPGPAQEVIKLQPWHLRSCCSGFCIVGWAPAKHRQVLHRSDVFSYRRLRFSQGPVFHNLQPTSQPDGG